ncbi:hypothetical protein [Tumebacillus lipolyticus]|uniref:Uncharacterized protein n=1 Tax=Tumebacillus lipolyticus TaxID=1280370 RepID=A0ABW5A3R6_9BACL
MIEVVAVPDADEREKQVRFWKKRLRISPVYLDPPNCEMTVLENEACTVDLRSPCTI